MIKVILWDIDGTILDFKQASHHAIHNCFAEFGLGPIGHERRHT